MTAALISPPIARPVTLAQVKQHLRIETLEDDDYLNDLIDASTNHLELVSGLKLIEQHWRIFLDKVPDNHCVRLSVSPVISIVEVRTYNAEGNPVLIDLQDLQLDSVSVPARLSFSKSLSSSKRLNGIEIDVVAGYGQSPADIPDSLKRALLLLIAHAFEFRGAVLLDQQPASEPHGFKTLIAPFKRLSLERT